MSYGRNKQTKRLAKLQFPFLALFLTTSLGYLPVSIQLFCSYFNIKRKLLNSPRSFIIRYPARKSRLEHIIANFWIKIYKVGITTYVLAIIILFMIMIVSFYSFIEIFQLYTENPMLQINVASFITRLIWVP